MNLFNLLYCECPQSCGSLILLPRKSNEIECSKAFGPVLKPLLILSIRQPASEYHGVCFTTTRPCLCRALWPAARAFFHATTFALRHVWNVPFCSGTFICFLTLQRLSTSVGRLRLSLFKRLSGNINLSKHPTILGSKRSSD